MEQGKFIIKNVVKGDYMETEDTIVSTYATYRQISVNPALEDIFSDNEIFLSSFSDLLSNIKKIPYYEELYGMDLRFANETLYCSVTTFDGVVTGAYPCITTNEEVSCHFSIEQCRELRDFLKQTKTHQFLLQDGNFVVQAKKLVKKEPVFFEATFSL